MSFQDAVRTVLQQKYADFNGRARRSEYWYFVLFGVIVNIVASILNSILRLPTIPGGSGLLPFLLWLALVVPGIAVVTRRLHDTGRSGWWQLISLTCIGIIVLIVWLIQDSQPQPNKYGPSPKGGPEFGGPAPYGGYGLPPQQ